MRLDHRSYRGKSVRPTPVVHAQDDGSLLLIVTPWGQSSAAERSIETVSDFVLSSRNDREVTSPFQRMTCLSPLANTVRVAMMLMNDTIYREINKSEYDDGLEVVICARHQNEIAIAQMGQPHSFLSRSGMPLSPVYTSVDLAMELSPAPRILPPLPSALLGLHSTSNFYVQSFHTQPGDQMIFLSRSHFPSAFMNAPTGQRNLQGFTQILAKDHPDLPFWLATVGF